MISSSLITTTRRKRKVLERAMQKQGLASPPQGQSLSSDSRSSPSFIQHITYRGLRRSHSNVSRTTVGILSISFDQVLQLCRMGPQARGVHPASTDSNGQSIASVSRPPLYADGTGTAPEAPFPGRPQGSNSQGYSFVSRPLCPSIEDSQGCRHHTYGMQHQNPVA